jgi:FlaA1/EpsC-like NDP-sugar epimerase
VIGIRPGEKIHEEMITPSDSVNTIDLGPYYAILPAGRADEYLAKRKVQMVEPNFSYNSGCNPEFLSVNEIRDLIRKHIDPAFEPA